MGDFLSLGSLNCSNIAGHKGTCSIKVACGHVHEELRWVRVSDIYAELFPFIQVISV